MKRYGMQALLTPLLTLAVVCCILGTLGEDLMMWVCSRPAMQKARPRVNP